MNPKAGLRHSTQNRHETAAPRPFPVAPLQTHFAPFSGANSRPQKRPHRTVSGTLLLSKQERNQRGIARCEWLRKPVSGQSLNRHATSGRKAPTRSATPLACPAPVAFCFIFRSKSKAQKTAPSHGFKGLAAIKTGAKSTKDRSARAVAKTGWRMTDKR